MFPHAALVALLLSAAPYTCSWIFPGGVPSTSSSCQPPPVTFSRSGSKTVRLTICAGTRCTSTSKTLDVLDPRPRIAGFSAQPQPAYTDEPVTLTAEATGRPPLVYSWKLPDGSLLSGNPVLVTPGKLSPASASIRLTVRNDQGTTSRTLVPKVLSPSPRIRSITLSPNPVYPQSQLSAAAEATGRSPLIFRWTFPDGTAREGSSVTWTVPDLPARSHSVSLTVSNASGSATSRQSLRVLAPAALRSFAPVCPGSCVFWAGQAVAFEIETTLADPSFEIDWNGDGTYDETVVSLRPAHSFSSPGFFRPRARVRLPNGRLEIRSSSRFLTITR